MSAKYGAAHQALRASLIKHFVSGTICYQRFRDGSICGRPMFAGQRLDLGHDENGGYIGLVHSRCNYRAAGEKQAWLRGRTCARCGSKYRVEPTARKTRLKLCPACKAGQPATPQPVSQGRRW